MIVTDSMLQKVDMPGLWFLKSSRPSSDISDLIYELSVKGCAHFFVRSQFLGESSRMRNARRSIRFPSSPPCRQCRQPPQLPRSFVGAVFYSMNGDIFRI